MIPGWECYAVIHQSCRIAVFFFFFLDLPHRIASWKHRCGTVEVDRTRRQTTSTAGNEKVAYGEDTVIVSDSMAG
jgi:hypothetical protein